MHGKPTASGLALVAALAACLVPASAAAFVATALLLGGSMVVRNEQLRLDARRTGSARARWCALLEGRLGWSAMRRRHRWWRRRLSR